MVESDGNVRTALTMNSISSFGLAKYVRAMVAIVMGDNSSPNDPTEEP